MKRYRVISDILGTPWHPTPDAAWEAYVHASQRVGVEPPLHRPGVVAGDTHQRGRTSGVRAHHGTVHLESR